MRRSVLAALLVFGTISFCAQAQATRASWGLIFNAENILLDIDSYQAGLGLKYRVNDERAFRFLIDAFYSNSSSTFAASLGGVFENHFWQAQVSPYWGAGFQAGYLCQNDEIDSANWTKTYSLPAAIGLILGAEYSVTKSVSVFAEFGATLNGTFITTMTSVGGSITDSSTVCNYSFDIGIGNDSKLGIIIYLDKPSQK